MGKKRLGDFIRKTDFLKISGDAANDRGNEVIDLEGQITDGDPQFEEVKDGFLAFAEKVGVQKFPERHSGGYWVAYSILCALDRIVGYFDEDEKAMKAYGKLYFDAWLALLTGGPSSGQTDLMSNMRNDHYDEYVKTLDKKQLAVIYSKMKITFHYNPSIEKDHDERLYADFVHGAIGDFFKCMEEEQLIASQKEFLELYHHYQKQLPGLSEEFATYIGYLLRDMASGFPDENPFMQTEETSGGSQSSNGKEALETLRTLICDKKISSQEQMDKLRADKTLEGVVGAYRKEKIPEVMNPLMSLMVEFSKSPGSEYGERIYGACRREFFRNMEDDDYVPDAKVFECVLDMVSQVVTHAKTTEPIESLIKEAFSACLKRFPVEKPAHTKPLVNLMTSLIKSGNTVYVHLAVRMLRDMTKHFVWKNCIDEVKVIFDILGKKPCEEMQLDRSDEVDKTISEYEDFCEHFVISLRKAKVVDKVQKELFVAIFDCMEIDNPKKSPMADELRRDLTLVKPDKGLIIFILERCKANLSNKDFTWDIDCTVSIQEILEAVINSYNENGKLVTPEQHQLFLDIFDIVMDGDSLDHFIEDDDKTTVYMRIFQHTVIIYYVLHRESSTQDCFLPVIPGIIKWARIASEENCEMLIDTCYMSLSNLSVKPVKGMEKYLKDIMDLLFVSEQYQHLSILITKMYPDNPEAVHERLQDLFDKFPMLKDNDQSMVLNIIMPISQTNPQVFSAQQIKSLVEWHLNPGEHDSLILVVIRFISEKNPKLLAPHLKSFLKPDKGPQPIVFSMKLYVIGNVAVLDKKMAEDALDFMVSCFKHQDPSVLHNLTGQIYTVMKFSPGYMQKYRPQVEKLQASATTPGIRDGCKNIINVLDGKSIEEVFDDVQQTKGAVTDMDKKVGATMNTVITLGEQVIEQDKDISKLQTDMDAVEERVDDVEEDLGETKVKVEEIDNKTMTNAPKWSRDLTKLMNPKSDTDWRLLAQRLGYSNDDIRGWAQQNDPCMAVLSEWYATHKTSEATHAILKILEDMNRTDCIVIVENAMKAAEGVVEDEEFEYPNPPPVFLSYQWGMQNEVKLLKQHLQMAGFECWMDIGQMGGGDKLFNKIDDGIRAAKVVISCTTEKYAKSPNCNREVNLAVNLGKPIIPLLMEKMAWPPKGSMGPIFSEYLFIRFFQRGGEETKDQRYWPLPKFSELLMQMNFYVVPDQSLVTKEYKNWWNPTAEEIIIDKNKGKGTATTTQSQSEPSESSDKSPEVFLSYQWGRQPQVKALYGRLSSLGYTIWMDIHQMGGGDSLYDKIDRGLRGCKVVVTCVTPKYSLSANCRREVSLADALKKPIIPLLLEEMKWPPDGPMSMVFTELLFINMWRDTEIQTKWTGPKFDELLQKLQQHVPSIQSAQNGPESGQKKNDVDNKQQGKTKAANTPSKAEDKPKPKDSSKVSPTKSGSITAQTKEAKQNPNENKLTPKDSSNVLPTKSGSVTAETKETKQDPKEGSANKTSKSCVLL